jgi:hypothetical protein
VPIARPEQTEKIIHGNERTIKTGHTIVLKNDPKQLKF